MKPAKTSDAQAVFDAVEVGDPVPYGFAFDGAAAYELEDADEQRIEDGGPVEEPPNPADLNPATGGTPTTTTTAAP